MLEGARERREWFLQLGVEPAASQAALGSSTQTFGWWKGKGRSEIRVVVVDGGKDRSKLDGNLFDDNTKQSVGREPGSNTEKEKGDG